MTTAKPGVLRLSLSSLIFIGMGLGIFAGVFLGEFAAFLAVLGDVWIKLLQMTVLPYVMLSLISGLGRLDYQQALLLARKAGLMLLLLWSVTLFVVFLFPYTFPDWQNSAVFSTAGTDARQQVDFIGLYIPSNLFHSLANNMVPAVVLFSFAVGVALIGVRKKHTLLDGMDVLLETLTRVANFVVLLTPIGVFAIMASAAGTLSLAELERLEVYVVSYIMISLLVSLWILPGLVTTLTPLSYRDVVGRSKDALVTAFATGSLFVVLPLLVEHSKQLLARYADNKEEGLAAVEVIVPASFNFPHAGKLFALSFILFAGWYSGYRVSATAYPELAAAGLGSLFASANVAIPFLLDLMRIPSDTFELFITTGVINARFATLLSAMFTLALTLLGAFAMTGQLRFSMRRIMRYLLFTGLSLTLVLGGLRFYFSAYLEDTYDSDRAIAERNLKRSTSTATLHLGEVSPLNPGLAGTRLEQVAERGLLRACYINDDVPFSYINRQGELVGHDVELLYYLAEDLGVSMEFVPSSTTSINQHLNSGYCDIGTTQIMTPAGALQGEYSVPVMHRMYAFLVLDHERYRFNSLESVISLKAPVIAMKPLPYYTRRLQRELPQASVILVESAGQFIAEHANNDADAMLLTREEALAWSLLHPEYAVAFPRDSHSKVPAAFPLPLDEERMADYLKTWIELKRGDGTLDDTYDYWILGKQAKAGNPRWSIVRDVLHWVD